MKVFKLPQQPTHKTIASALRHLNIGESACCKGSNAQLRQDLEKAKVEYPLGMHGAFFFENKRFRMDYHKGSPLAHEVVLIIEREARF